MYNVTVTCGEIQTDGGFEFKLSSDSLNQTLNGDCEQSWYLQDGRLIADPSDPQKLIDPATAVKSDRLFTSYCVNLKHEIICDSANRLHYSREIMFRVRNETAATPNSDVLNEASLQHSDQLWWLFALIIIIIIIICFLLHKRIFRAETSVCQREDPENKDPESGVQMKLRSDDCRSDQMIR